MNKLLTKKDLAERWQVSEQTIDQYRQNGIIVAIKGLPCVRFNEQYIEKIEGRIPEKTTMRERRLEKELSLKDMQIAEMKNIIAKIQALTIKYIYEDVINFQE